MLQTLNIKIEVTLPNGAAVTMTDTQQKTTEKFITETIFGTPIIEKPAPRAVPFKKRRMRSVRRNIWTPEEDQKLLDLIIKHKQYPKGTRQGLAKAKMKLAKELNRTFKGVDIRYYHLLGSQPKTIQVNSGSGFRGIPITLLD